MSVLRVKHNVLATIRQLTFATVMLCLALSATAQSPTEDQVKAVFIYNFLNFIEWPSSSFKTPTDPFVIGVAGEERFHELLKEAVAGERYQGRAIQITMVKENEELAKCHMVYIEKNHAALDVFLSIAKDKSILTIGNSDDFMVKRGLVRFFVQDNKVKIEINANAAKAVDLKISSKLLRLASIYDR